MARKATGCVTTVDIDIGKHSFHLIGLDDRSGSGSAFPAARPAGPLMRVKLPK